MENKNQRGFFSSLKSSSVKSIYKWSKGNRLPILLISIGNMLYAGLRLVFALVTRELVDSAVDKNKNGIIKYAIIITSIIAVQLISDYLLSKYQNYVTYKLKISMRRNLLKQILNKQYSEISVYHSGELVNRMFSDVNIISEGIINIIPPLALFLTQLIGASIILASIDLKFLIAIILIAVVSLVTGLLFKKKSKRLHREMQENEGKVHAVLQESLQNVRLIKASESEEHIENKTEESQQHLFRSQMRRTNFTLFAGTGIRTIFRGSWLFSMLWGCVNIATDSISYGTLTAILQLVNQIQSPFASMSGLLSKFYATLSSGERLEEIFNLPDEEPKVNYNEKANEIYNELNNISFNNIKFSYKNGEPVIKKADFTVNKGDFVAVTGLSGGGKSTTFLLLLGIYTPTKGSIKFNLQNDKTLLAGRNTRCLFSYVPQGNTLFSGTLRENLSMFCGSATDKELHNAAKIACIDDFIASLPEGLDTVIGERGLGISEGQAQRIAIARAFLSNSPILLLDESTSALDEKTEAKLLKNISSQKNRTCFIVTHRKAALSICNKQIFISDGEIFQSDI